METGKINFISEKKKRDGSERGQVREEERWDVNRTRQTSNVARTHERMRGKERETNPEGREIPGERWAGPDKVTAGGELLCPHS